MSQDISFGQILHEKRIERLMTQQELAEKLDVDARIIRRWELDQAIPRTSIIVKLASILGVSLQEFTKHVGVLQDPVQRIQQSIDQVAETDPKNIQEVAASQLKIINNYYLSGLQQSQQSFRWSLIWGGIGLGFLIVSVVVLFFRQPTEIAYASVIGGAIVEVLAGTYLYLYKHASDQLATFRIGLENTQRLLLANSMCEKLEGDMKQNTQAELIHSIVVSISKVG